ncbi:MAG: homocysteine S-methyltransferase family protein [Pseudomonadota bacterium]
MSKRPLTLPQQNRGLFLTDAGLETDLIFNHNVEIHEFAAHTLLSSAAGRAALTHYFRGFLELARLSGSGFVLDCTTWKAHSHWADDLGASAGELRLANESAVSFAAALRAEYAGNKGPIVLNAVIGPRGDAYAPDGLISAAEAEDYHSEQLGWLAATDVDMVSALTHTQSSEAIGITRAAAAVGLPIVISFTVETDGRLPTGETLQSAIETVDATTGRTPAYYMINCAHPDHFVGELADEPWLRRIRGLRCNASRKSHAELDESAHLDCGDPQELGEQYRMLVEQMPWVNVLGGCCGSDLRHLTAIVAAITGEPQRRRA